MQLRDELPVPEAATLNPRYTFDTFVAGPSNQLAFAASQAAASSYPPKYNPVFICGGVGLGKTHLLHAIGHQQLANRPGARIVYISSERFINEYVQAIRTGRMHEFRRNYREGIDVLLVDDVQFLAGKESTQDEFFHTFNALHENHKQIVLTADRKPHEISDVADRLRTRFAWGLLADIEPPELEVRIAILRKKAAVEAVHLPDDVALYIASAIKSNVRELEGALIRLAAYASLSKRHIDLEFAQETLGAAITRPREIIMVGLDHQAGRELLRREAVRHQERAPPQVGRHAARGRDVPRAASYEGLVPRPRARVRRQAPHHGHFRGAEDRASHEGRSRAAQRAARDHRIDLAVTRMFRARPRASLPLCTTLMAGLWMDPWQLYRRRLSTHRRHRVLAIRHVRPLCFDPRIPMQAAELQSCPCDPQPF